jgi:hypothetical protein
MLGLRLVPAAPSARGYSAALAPNTPISSGRNILSKKIFLLHNYCPYVINYQVLIIISKFTNRSKRKIISQLHLFLIILE